MPDEPILFDKSCRTFCGLNDDILLSKKMSKLDCEVEQGIVFGKSGLNISSADAHDHGLCYTLANDVSERAWQLERGVQWANGKSFPNFCPTGPWIVSGDKVGDAAELDMWLDVTGTPPGVGMGMNPQVWLRASDHVTQGIKGIGEQVQSVVAL